MFNVGPLELMVLLVLALIVFGPAKLPELMGSVGNAIREFQRASRELTEVFQETQEEFSSALDLESPVNTVTEPAVAPSANGHAETEMTTTVPVVVPVSTAPPSEYETAAAMVDPVQPFPEPTPSVAESLAAVPPPEETKKPQRARARKTAPTREADDAAPATVPDGAGGIVELPSTAGQAPAASPTDADEAPAKPKPRRRARPRATAAAAVAIVEETG